jgi:hypothetical protein
MGVWMGNSISSIGYQKDNASVIQRARDQGNQQANPIPLYPGVSHLLLSKNIMMAPLTSPSPRMDVNIRTNESGLNLPTATTSTQVEGLERQLIVGPSLQQSLQQVSISLHPQRWFEVIWDILSGTVKYIIWNFEDLHMQFQLWDGSAWGLLSHMELIWRVLMTGAIVFGIAMSGPLIDAMIRIIQITWDVMSVAARGIMGAAEEIWSVLASWMRTLEDLFSSL